MNDPRSRGVGVRTQEARRGRVAEIRHIGIVVSDLAASLAFYAGLLGLRLGNGGEESGKELDRIFGMPNVHLRTQKLLTDRGDARVELVELLEPTHVTGAARGLTDVGITHFAITVDDIELTYRELRSAGVTFVSAPERDASGFAKVAFCRDPDGNLIELIEVQRKGFFEAPAQR